MKKGQVTIFVIVAIFIVIAILLIFVLKNKNIGSINLEENPKAYIENCINNYLVESERKIFENNGYLKEINSSYILYKGEKVPYSCKSSEFYSPCVNQDPLIIERIRNELKKEIEPKAKICFDDAIRNLRDKGYDVESGNFSMEVNFNLNNIELNVDKIVKIKKDEFSSSFDGAKIEMNSPLYNLIKLEQTITNFESFYCEFDEISWMALDRDHRIQRFRAGDQSKIYTITDILTEKEIKFAVRTCILPAGI